MTQQQHNKTPATQTIEIQDEYEYEVWQWYHVWTVEPNVKVLLAFWGKSLCLERQSEGVGVFGRLWGESHCEGFVFSSVCPAVELGSLFS